MQPRETQRQPRQATDLVIQNEVRIESKKKRHLSTRDNRALVLQYLSVTCDGTTGLLKSITDLNAQKTYNVAQNFYYYLGMAGFNSYPDNRASGAYVFRPNGTSPTPVGSTVTATIINVSIMNIMTSKSLSRVIFDTGSSWVAGTSGARDTANLQRLRQSSHTSLSWCYLCGIGMANWTHTN